MEEIEKLRDVCVCVFLCIIFCHGTFPRVYVYVCVFVCFFLLYLNVAARFSFLSFFPSFLLIF